MMKQTIYSLFYNYQAPNHGVPTPSQILRKAIMSVSKFEYNQRSCVPEQSVGKQWFANVFAERRQLTLFSYAEFLNSIREGEFDIYTHEFPSHYCSRDSESKLLRYLSTKQLLDKSICDSLRFQAMGLKHKKREYVDHISASLIPASSKDAELLDKHVESLTTRLDYNIDLVKKQEKELKQAKANADAYAEALRAKDKQIEWLTMQQEHSNESQNHNDIDTVLLEQELRAKTYQLEKKDNEIDLLKKELALRDQTIEILKSQLKRPPVHMAISANPVKRPRMM